MLLINSNLAFSSGSLVYTAISFRMWVLERNFFPFLVKYLILLKNVYYEIKFWFSSYSCVWTRVLIRKQIKSSFKSFFKILERIINRFKETEFTRIFCQALTPCSFPFSLQILSLLSLFSLIFFICFLSLLS